MWREGLPASVAHFRQGVLRSGAEDSHGLPCQDQACGDGFLRKPRDVFEVLCRLFRYVALTAFPRQFCLFPCLYAT